MLLHPFNNFNTDTTKSCFGTRHQLKTKHFTTASSKHIVTWLKKTPLHIYWFLFEYGTITVDYCLLLTTDPVTFRDLYGCKVLFYEIFCPTVTLKFTGIKSWKEKPTPVFKIFQFFQISKVCSRPPQWENISLYIHTQNYGCYVIKKQNQKRKYVRGYVNKNVPTYER